VKKRLQTLLFPNATCPATPRGAQSPKRERQSPSPSGGAAGKRGSGTPNFLKKTASVKGKQALGKVIPASPVGLYKLNAIYPDLESAWFQPLNLLCDILVSKFAFKINLYHYNPAAPRSPPCCATAPRFVAARP
jgi:hypothetical protein